jgi:hypothetical protein
MTSRRCRLCKSGCGTACGARRSSSTRGWRRLESLVEPIHHLVILSFRSVIRRDAGTRPYQAVPFLGCVETTTAHHDSGLQVAMAQGQEDPRPFFAHAERAARTLEAIRLAVLGRCGISA